MSAHYPELQSLLHQYQCDFDALKVSDQSDPHKHQVCYQLTRDLRNALQIYRDAPALEALIQAIQTYAENLNHVQASPPR